MAANPLVPPRTRDQCCYASAVELSATFCGSCGKPLLRCMAYAECGGLVDDVGLCTICVAPHVQLTPGAMTNAQVGGEVALPFDLANLSPVGRPLFVTGLWSREGRGDWRRERLDWERLEAGTRAAAAVTAASIERAGTHKIDIMVTVSTRWRWRQESWAFATSVLLTIDDNDDKGGGHVIQITGEGHGNLINISGQVGGEAGEAKRISQAIDLPMQRLDIAERDLGLRGLDTELRVPRGTPVKFAGFAKGDVPPGAARPIVTPNGLLAFGRARTSGEGAGDVRLVALGADGAAADEDLSRMISRRHFELYIENDRLVLRVTGSNGVRVNGDAYGPDKCVALKDGDRIAPIVDRPDALWLDVRFSCELDRVSAITLTRHPKCEGGM